MRRKPKKRSASKPVKKAKKTTRSKVRKTSQKRKPARSARARARTKSAVRATKRPKVKRVAAKPGSVARGNGAPTRKPAAQREPGLEQPRVEHEEEGLNIGGYDESEELDETYTEEEEEGITEESEEDY